MNQNDLSEQIRHVTSVQAKYTDQLMRIPHVTGIAVGFARKAGEMTPELSLIVMVDEKVSDDDLEPAERIPKELDGVRVDVQETGLFGAF
jgi:hypothetical protein